MSTQRADSLPEIVLARLNAGSAGMQAALIVVASLVIALSAQIALPLPFSPVPMTLQPLAVLLVGALLGSTRGFAAAALYLLQGALGLPFFAHGTAGLVFLLGPTGGYLFAFPVAAGIAGFLSERGWTRSIAASLASLTFALGVIYISGWSWLVAVYGLTTEQAFAAGVLPFLLADLLKVTLAALLLPSLRRL